MLFDMGKKGMVAILPKPNDRFLNSLYKKKEENSSS